MKIGYVWSINYGCEDNYQLVEHIFSNLENLWVSVEEYAENGVTRAHVNIDKVVCEDDCVVEVIEHIQVATKTFWDSSEKD